MRTMLNRLAIDGEIVIGEGEIDEAPMLYIGEKVGQIYNEEEKIQLPMLTLWILLLILLKVLE